MSKWPINKDLDDIDLKIEPKYMNGIDKVQDTKSGEIHSFFDWISWNKWFR